MRYLSSLYCREVLSLCSVSCVLASWQNTEEPTALLFLLEVYYDLLLLPTLLHLVFVTLFRFFFYSVYLVNLYDLIWVSIGFLEVLCIVSLFWLICFLPSFLSLCLFFFFFSNFWNGLLGPELLKIIASRAVSHYNFEILLIDWLICYFANTIIFF